MRTRESRLPSFWALSLIILILSLDCTNSLKTKPKGPYRVTTTASSQTDETVSFPLKVGSQNESSGFQSISSRVLQIVNPDFENQMTSVSKPSNSDIIVGKDVGKGSRIILECSAPFPVQWIYTGDGMPEISTNTSIKSAKKSTKNSGHFTATAALGFNRKLQESDTGEYVCRSVQNPEQSIYYYIYVPGKSLFTSAKGHSIEVPDFQNFIRIPCSVTHPDVLVTLQKKGNGFLQCPVKNSVAFSPKTGFLINTADIDEYDLHLQDDVSGDYICIAGLNGSFQLLEYSVKRTSAKPFFQLSSGDSSVNQDDDDSFEIHVRNEEGCPQFQNPCGPNSICRMIPGNQLPVCKCRFGYIGSPPKCQPESRSVCNPSPCGPNSRCHEIPTRKGIHPHCSCLPAYIGRPPNCRPECLLNLDCPLAMACVDQQCEDPCDGYCGQGAVCQVQDHVPICSCPPGYSGNPKRKCGRTRSPSLNYFPAQSSRPGYPNDPKPIDGDNKPDVQMNFPCQPWPCGPFSECRPVGENAHCSCAPGYMGLPPNCHPECRRDSDCSSNKACVEAKCRDPCLFSITRCGTNADCFATNHQPDCQCRSGFRGNPLIKCTVATGGQNNNNNDQGQGHLASGSGSFPQSPSSSSEESFPPPPNKRPVIVGGGYPGPMSPPSDNDYRPTSKPTNQNSNDFPCRNSPCGRNAICSFRNHTIGCKCPETFTGFGSDPYVECFPSNDPCEVCGPNSECRVRKNRKPLCSCLPGKVGSPPNCKDKTPSLYCWRNADCPDQLACERRMCTDPCRRADCGQQSICRGLKHQAVCACPNAPDRDPLYGCLVFE